MARPLAAAPDDRVRSGRRALPMADQLLEQQQEEFARLRLLRARTAAPAAVDRRGASDVTRRRPNAMPLRHPVRGTRLIQPHARLDLAGT
jgi:hypothetical protein